MKKQVCEIDRNGFILEIYVKDFDDKNEPIEKLPENIIVISPPNGLYRAKWTGAEWAEDMTQIDIDALNNVISEQTTEEKIATMAEELVIVQEKLNASQEALDFIIMGGM